MRCGTTATATVARFARERGGIFRVLLMTNLREGLPVPVRDGPVGEDEGVDSFNDFLAIIARCLPHDVDAFARAAYLWADSTAASRSATPSPRSRGRPKTSTSSGCSRSTSPPKLVGSFGDRRPGRSAGSDQTFRAVVVRARGDHGRGCPPRCERQAVQPDRRGHATLGLGLTAASCARASSTARCA
jgi:hypothetical protein